MGSLGTLAGLALTRRAAAQTERTEADAAPLFSEIATIRLSKRTTSFRTSGYAHAGRGGARYILDSVQSDAEGRTAWRSRSADGRWWVLDEAEPTPLMFGAIGDGSTDDRVALQEWLNFGAGVVPVAAIECAAGRCVATIASTARLRTGQRVCFVGVNEPNLKGEHPITVASSTTVAFSANPPAGVTRASFTGAPYMTTRAVPLFLGSDEYAVHGDLTVPVGAHSPTVRGSGIAAGTIKLVGSDIKHGLFFDGRPTHTLALSGTAGTFVRGETVSGAGGMRGTVVAHDPGGGMLYVAGISFAEQPAGGHPVVGETSGARAIVGLTASAVYAESGEWSNLRIVGDGVAGRGITLYGVEGPRFSQMQVRYILGEAIASAYVLTLQLEQCQLFGNGAPRRPAIATEGFGSCLLINTYISGSHRDTPAGLRIDRAGSFTMLGGVIESTGIPVQIASAPEAEWPVWEAIFIGVDFENPAAPDPLSTCYCEAGYGWTGPPGFGVRNLKFLNCNGSPSGTAAFQAAMRLKNTVDFRCESSHFAMTGSPVATFAFEGVNYGAIVEAQHSRTYSNPHHWVSVDGAPRKEATPFVRWSMDSVAEVRATGAQQDAGAVISCSVSPLQGGIYGHIEVANRSPQRVVRMTGGVRDCRVIVSAADGNTILVHGTGQDEFFLKAGRDLALAAGASYEFLHTGTRWSQLN